MLTKCQGLTFSEMTHGVRLPERMSHGATALPSTDLRQSQRAASFPPEVSPEERRVPKIQLPLENKGNICVLSSGDVNGNIIWVWGCFGAAQALHHVLEMMGQTGMLLARHMGHELVLLWDDFRMSPKG